MDSAHRRLGVEAMWAGLARFVVGLGMAIGLLARPSCGHAAAPVFGTSSPVNGGAVVDKGNDGAPRIVTDGRGTWVTVWASTDELGGRIGTDSDVLAARSNDLGISWSAAVPVNTTAAIDEEFDFAPALATDGGGTWVAVWAATNGADTDIFVARSTDAGSSWSAALPLYADAATDAGSDDHPQIVTDGSGVWMVVWDSIGRFGNDRDILVAHSRDSGVTWSAPVAIGKNATTDRGVDQRPQLATDGRGQWIVVWASNDTLGGTKGNDFDVLVARSADGGATWTPPLPLNTNAGRDRGLDDRPQVATDGHGSWVAAWVSDDTLGGTLGSDLDVLMARSTDDGVVWSAPAALNTNAATDRGEDGAPAVVTDRLGTWVAIWESNDSLAGTLGDDHDILMAHSIDGGAHWSAPHALDSAAASDAQRDISPQLATDGAGMWNAVWAVLGGTLGKDSDVVRAGGRERCGDGAVDPGEQCDDGNTLGGDVCPASCEFPPPSTPIATATPQPTGSTPALGPSGAATPSEGAVGTATSSFAGSATPSAEGGITPSATPSPDLVVTATARSSGASPSTPTPKDESGATATGGGAGTPSPVVTAFGGGLASTAAAKAAVACQRAVVKAGGQLTGARLSSLGGCARAVQRCIQTKPDDSVCMSKAATRCRSALAALAAGDRRGSATLRKHCGGRLSLAEVLGPAGLGYASSTCGEDDAVDSFDDLIDCVVAEHACRGAGLFEILQPRAKELLRLPGMNAATLDTIVCLPDHGGDGAAVHDAAGQGKAVASCVSAVVKAGTSFVRKRLAREARCVDGLFSCVQLAADDGSCLAAARTRCDRGQVTNAVDERKLTGAVAARCGEPVIAYATLRAARGVNLDALTDVCAAVGVHELETLADYQRCVLRANACRVEGVLRVQVPRVAELMGLVGRSFGSPFCSGS